MRAIDLFCGAGGASAGLVAAGFEVVGVDIEPQPEYPFDFVQADALTYSLDGFDLIWASPKCQFACAYKRRRDHVRPSPNMIPAVRERLIASGAAYIIENVEGAREHLRAPALLCGSMFGLDVQRHRLFETSFSVLAPDCDHGRWAPRFPCATNRTNLRKTVEVGVYRIPLATQKLAMGISWMSLGRPSQAIPPAHAEWLGRRALEHIRAKRAA